MTHINHIREMSTATIQHEADPEDIEETLEEHQLNEADDWYSAQRADGRL